MPSCLNKIETMFKSIGLGLAFAEWEAVGSVLQFRDTPFAVVGFRGRALIVNDGSADTDHTLLAVTNLASVANHNPEYLHPLFMDGWTLMAHIATDGEYAEFTDDMPYEAIIPPQLRALHGGPDYEAINAILEEAGFIRLPEWMDVATRMFNEFLDTLP